MDSLPSKKVMSKAKVSVPVESKTEQTTIQKQQSLPLKEQKVPTKDVKVPAKEVKAPTKDVKAPVQDVKPVAKLPVKPTVVKQAPSKPIAARNSISGPSNTIAVSDKPTKSLTNIFAKDISNQVDKINQLKQDMLKEQEIKPDLQKMAKQANKPTYNLEKGLSFEIKTLQKHYQFNSEQDQSFPVMVSVKTLDSTTEVTDEEQKENAKSLDSRPSLDLICVIDNSGSMQGEKIKNVKTTLLQLVDMLNENDRLSLILFNSYPVLLCNLRKVDGLNKEGFKSIINSIKADGGTDINSGMTMAFNILKQRKCFNPVSSIFLLSDGQDGGADERIKNYINNDKSSLKSECFTIHSFGFGSDHDGPLMNRICELKDGNFYYVEKIDQVDEFFIDALGGLFSVVAQEILIEININRSDANFKKFFSNSRVSKTYGEMWKCLKQDEVYQIRINQLFSGVSKDFIFEITVPKSEIKSLEDFERNLEVVKGQLSAIPVDIQYSTKIVKDNNLVLTLFKQEETVPVDSEINDNVEFNYLRVKVAEAMEVAISFAEKQQYDQGQLVLQDMLKKMDKSHPNNKEKLTALKKDIIDCQESAKPRVYEHEGKYKMLSKKAANFKQQSKAVEECDIYQNNVQKQMVMMQKAKK